VPSKDRRLWDFVRECADTPPFWTLSTRDTPVKKVSIHNFYNGRWTGPRLFTVHRFSSISHRSQGAFTWFLTPPLRGATISRRQGFTTCLTFVPSNK
jgi:hypothetical protein